MKRFFTLLLTLILTLSSIQVFAASDTLITNENELKLAASKTSTEIMSTKNSTSLSTSEFESIDKAARIREQQYRQNEKDVADIIFKMTKNSTLQQKAIDVDKAGRIEVIKYIISSLGNTNKKTLSKSDELKLTNYIQSYGPYTGDASILSYLSNSQNTTLNYTIMATSVFDRTSAVTYAHTYYNTFNTPTYPNVTALGGDCANFISQCLVAGGKATDSTWYITRKNTTYTSPTTVDQLNQSWTLASPSPWISAKEFNNYWSSKASSTYTASGEYVYNNKSIIFGKPYYRGDAVQILKKNFWWYEGYHTMLITGYVNNDFVLTYHTSATKDKALNTIANTYKGSDWQFKFFGM